MSYTWKQHNLKTGMISVCISKLNANECCSNALTTCVCMSVMSTVCNVKTKLHFSRYKTQIFIFATFLKSVWTQVPTVTVNTNLFVSLVSCWGILRSSRGVRDLTRRGDELLKQCNDRPTLCQLFHIAVMGKIPRNFPPNSLHSCSPSCSGCHAWLPLQLSTGIDHRVVGSC